VQTNPAQAPEAPAATQATANPAAQTVTTVVTLPPAGAATAREMYEAMRSQRQVIQNQLDNALSDRYSIASRIREGEISGPDKAGLEQRLEVMDARIIELQQHLATAERQEALAAALPGAHTRDIREQRAEEREIILGSSIALMFVIAIPMTLVWARRLWKKNAVTINLPPELGQRLDSIERGIEATAIEVERIGEGQRFVTQLLAQRDEQARVALPADRGR
jgi:hypothetical protein